MSDPKASYQTLIEKIDVHSERVAQRAGAALRCRLGCTACCRQDLNVCRLEADLIAEWLDRHDLPPADDALGPHDDHPLFDALARGRACAFLGSGGACRIYEVRPVICRTHGLPVRRDDYVDACPLNFRGQDLGELEHDLPLSLDTVETLLGLANHLYCEATGRDDGRTALSSLAASLNDDY